MGTLYVVATPIGNLKDITNRALEVLSNVDLIACEDTRTSSILLKHFNINNKLVSYHKFNEKGKSNSLIDDLIKGKDIALISDAGCPCISDPGTILVHEAIKNNIEVIPIPGASAVVSSLMVCGMDTSSFSFYGFLSRDNKELEDELNKIKKDYSHLTILYESPKRIIKTLNKIYEILNNPYIMVGNDLTKKFETKYYGKTKEVIEKLNSNDKKELGEYVLIIEKEKYLEKKENNLSIEALIIDEMMKNNCTMKDAIKLVSDKYHYNKNLVYEASLRLKKYLNI